MHRKLAQITIDEKINKLKTRETTLGKAVLLINNEQKKYRVRTINHKLKDKSKVKKERKNSKANYITKHPKVVFIFISLVTKQLKLPLQIFRM